MMSISSKDDYSYLLNDNSYNFYKIKIDGLNTNNIFDYVDRLDIISIYPSINPIYKSQLGDFVYHVGSKNMYDEINRFKDSYLKLIKKNNYTDYNYLYVHGINIDMIDVYMSSNDLYNFLSNNSASGRIVR